MEIAPWLHYVKTTHGNRLLNQYILLGDSITLIDAGSINTPEDVILPYIKGLGRDPSEITMIIITHGDVDHFGGLSAIRKVAPNSVIVAHKLDIKWINDPDAVIQERYNRHKAIGVDYGTDLLVELRQLIGKPDSVDFSILGGETIFLHKEWPIDILHAPGHTPGQICLHDPRNKWAIIGDAITGKAQIDLNGNPSTPPYYYHRDQYLETILTIEALNVDLLLTSHYPLMRGNQISEFINASRAFVFEADKAILDILADAQKALTLPQIIEKVNPVLGPYEGVIFLAECVRAHLEWMVSKGKVWRGLHNHLPAWSIKL
jgi:glyoxylase-like metal-dependent hydrolase (beta-lactamase superfamily II)